MKSLYQYFFFILCLALSIAGQAQEETKDNSKQDRDRAEKNTAPFSLDYFNKPGNSHLVLTLQVKEGKLVADEQARVQKVQGKMPYPTGNLSVKILDKQGELIDQYQMQDPLIVRSCEDEKSETKSLQNGSIQLMLPSSANVATVVLERNKQRVQQVDVKAVMERYRRGSKNPDDEGGE